MRRHLPLRLPLAAALTGLILAGCSMGGLPTAPGALAPGLSARMDLPGATLDRAQAIDLVNAYRVASGVAPLSHDAALDGTAQVLANQYAQTGNAPGTPQGLKVMKLSAGYATFAETFSGWRNVAADAAGLRAGAAKAGIGVAFNPGSAYGIHWVLVLAD